MEHPLPVLEYFARIGAEVLNFRRAMVKQYKGSYYIERALIKINDAGEVTSSNKAYAPTDEEAAAMKAALQKVDYPRTIGALNSNGLKGLVTGDIYEFWDRKRGEIVMVQERRLRDDGTKAYLPWVFMSDGVWRSMEPDGELPFWKMPTGEGPGGKIMIHEGAKAAAAVTQLLISGAEHPWRDELAEYEHWGMIGGALAPHRTDYSELVREAPREVVYVCDNDHAGISALQKVSKAWGRGLKGIVFGKQFPASWDLADPMPVGLFGSGGRWLGPRLKDLMEPATWATEVVPPPSGKGRSVTVMRPEFVEEWQHCVTPEVFVHRDWPWRVLGGPEFNSRVAPFSHLDDTARVLKHEFASKAAVLRYDPSRPPGVYGGSKSGLFINTHCPSDVRPEGGDAGPWLEFMEMLVPGEGDREELMRWCATLIARPATRMLYGVLMISETQGVGKGTLGEKILAPLVGEANVSYPSEQEIVESQYNYWLAHKRLAVVHEIYAGQSSKAYNKLKSSITDRNVTVQKKYQANYEIENWIHVFACSNSMRAMKLSMDDRRWFVPRLTEEKAPQGYWDTFNRWLTYEGGLGIILGWAHDWLREHSAVERGAIAPWSALKKTIVEEGYSPGQALVARVLEEIARRVEVGELPEDTFVLDHDLVELIKSELYEGRQNERLERPATVRGVAKGLGWHVGETRAQVRDWGPGSIGGRVLALRAEVARTAPGDLGGDRVAVERRRRPLDVRGVVGV